MTTAQFKELPKDLQTVKLAYDTAKDESGKAVRALLDSLGKRDKILERLKAASLKIQASRYKLKDDPDNMIKIINAVVEMVDELEECHMQYEELRQNYYIWDGVRKYRAGKAGGKN